MRPRTTLWIALLLTLGATTASGSPRIGAALLRSDSTACVTFRGEPRRAGDPLFLFLFSPPRVVDGRIEKATSTSCNEAMEMEGQSYRVRMRHAISDVDEVGVAIYDLSARVEYVNGEFVVRTEGASAPLQMRRCTSSEGLHLTTWRGNRRTWHEYWYLGFDVEPDCSEGEAAP